MFKKVTVALAAGLALAGSVALSGCGAEQLEDGYQFGDATSIAVEAAGNAGELRRRWCEGGDKVARTVLIGVVRAWLPLYPEGGVCSDSLFLSTLAAAVARGKPEPVVDPL